MDEVIQRCASSAMSRATSTPCVILILRMGSPTCQLYRRKALALASSRSLSYTES
jgi:hypothetical protein